MLDRATYLRRCTLFYQLTADQIRPMEARSRCHTLPAGDAVYRPSERADTVFLLTSGMVRVCHLTPDGKKSILAFVESGEMFGELAIFDAAQRDEYAEAVARSTIVAIPTAEIHHLMVQYPDVALAVTRMIDLRRHRIERRLKNLLFLSNRERLIHLLLDLADQFGWQAEDGIRLRVRLTHQDLANWIGSTRETVTVLLGQLKTEGRVDIGRQRITLRDVTGLARSVNRRPPRTVAESLPHGVGL